MTTAIIIPGYNEEERIADVVKKTKQAGYSLVIVVDDGSRDKTGKQATNAGATVLTHIVNMGKGAAMKTGAEYAVQIGAEKIIFIDGDGQHEAEEIVKFDKALDAYDVALGKRRANRTAPWVRKLGGQIINWWIKLLYGINVHDCLNGFRGFTAQAYSSLEWQSADYSVESEIIANLGKSDLTYKEITIKTIYHDKYKGMTPMHGFQVLWNLLMWRLQR